MSIVFGTVATSDRIDFGAGSTLSNLADWTYIAWVYRTSNANNQHIISKDNTAAAPRGPRIVFETGTRCELRVAVGASTTSPTVVVANGTSRINRWECVAGTFKTSTLSCGAAVGTETEPMYQPAYGTNTVGVGTVVADTGFSLWVCNLQRAPTNPFFGGIAWAGVYPRVLTLAEMEQWRQDTMAGRVPNTPGARLL